LEIDFFSREKEQTVNNKAVTDTHPFVDEPSRYNNNNNKNNSHFVPPALLDEVVVLM
jgi:hypothetical protein